MKKRNYAIGCYGDGSFGHAHVRQRLADLVEEYSEDLAEELRGEMSDDGGEEDGALEVLNEHTANDGVVWEFVDGDLMLSRLVSENSGV